MDFLKIEELMEIFKEESKFWLDPGPEICEEIPNKCCREAISYFLERTEHNLKELMKARGKT